MTIGMTKGSSLVALKEEVTEGVALEPTASAEFVQVLQDGLSMSPSKELVGRSILTNSIGKVAPRSSTKAFSGSVPVEFKASGVEGEAPEYALLINSLLGNSVVNAAQITTDTGHSSTTLEKTAHGLTEGQIITILEAGSHSTHFVTSATTTNQIVFTPAASYTPSDAVLISKSVTYSPANSGQPTFTANVYWSDAVLEQGIGCRSNSMSLEGFSTGGVSSLNFGIQGLDFDEIVASAPVSPAYDASTPPIILSAFVSQGTSCIELNDFSLSVENTVSLLNSVCSESGSIASRFTERVLSGSFNPYKDDASVSFFTQFNENTPFSLTITIQNPSAVSGEFDLGSICGIYLPSCLLTSKTVADADGTLIEEMEFSANRGTDGLTEEIYLGFV